MDFFKFQETVQPVSKMEDADWINLEDPDQAELETVAELCGLEASFLAEPLDLREHPRVEQTEAALLIVIRCAADWHPDSDDSFGGTVPVGIFIQPKRLITICRQPLVMNSLKPVLGKNRTWSPMLITGCLFRSCGNGFISILEKLEDQSDLAEARLRLRPENDALLSLLNIQKTLIGLTVALKSDHGLLEKFRLKDPFGLHLTANEKSVLEEAAIETQQAVFTAEIFGQVLASMSDAFGSIISNNLNKIMKFLAGVTIVLMLPTIVAGLYGMNVTWLPGAVLTNAFWLICTFLLAMMLLFRVYFAQ